MAGIENLACAFGFDRNIRALARAFGVGDCPCNKYENMLFGTDGIISCTLDYWMEVIHDLCNQIEELRAQIEQLSTKILRDLSEPEKALSKRERRERATMRSKRRIEHGRHSGGRRNDSRQPRRRWLMQSKRT